MQAIVYLLNNSNSNKLTVLCNELNHTFRACGVYVTTFPHMSYHVARGYEWTQLEPLLTSLTAEVAPFTIQTTGLGLFTGDTPILHVPVVRTLALSQFHQRLWDMLAPLAQDAGHNYHPQNWVPHITLAYGDLNKENLPPIIQTLSQRRFDWQLTVDNLALIYNNEGEQGLQYNFPLMGK